MVGIARMGSADSKRDSLAEPGGRAAADRDRAVRARRFASARASRAISIGTCMTARAKNPGAAFAEPIGDLLRLRLLLGRRKDQCPLRAELIDLAREVIERAHTRTPRGPAAGCMKKTALLCFYLLQTGR